MTLSRRFNHPVEGIAGHRRRVDRLFEEGLRRQHRDVREASWRAQRRIGRSRFRASSPNRLTRASSPRRPRSPSSTPGSLPTRGSPSPRPTPASRSNRTIVLPRSAARTRSLRANAGAFQAPAFFVSIPSSTICVIAAASAQRRQCVRITVCRGREKGGRKQLSVVPRVEGLARDGQIGNAAIRRRHLVLAAPRA